MFKGSRSAGHDGKMPILKFAVKFGAIMLLFYALAETAYCQRVFWPANMQANAWVSNWILCGLQQHTQAAGDTIKTGNYAFVVKRGCDATEPVWLLAAAMIAFPARWRQKLLGIFLGASLLLAINQLRIVCLFFVGRYDPDLYDTMHLTVFPAIFVVLAMLLWAGWAGWTAGNKRVKTDAIP